MVYRSGYKNVAITACRGDIENVHRTYSNILHGVLP